MRTVPGVRKAVKWNSPSFGVEGQGWFLNFHCITNYLKVAFFRGMSLRPVPPGESKHKDVRYLDIHEDQLDETQLAAWVRTRMNGSRATSPPTSSATFAKCSMWATFIGFKSSCSWWLAAQRSS